MTSVTGNTHTTSPFAPQRPHGSPKDRATQSIEAEVASGQISASDGTALTGALDSISSSLDGDAAGSASASTAKRDPSDLKAKVDGLVDDQVKSGALTDDQAKELKGILGKDHGGHGGHGSAAASGSAASTDAAGAAGGTSDLLADFIKTVQRSQTTSASGYAASGSSASGQVSSALLFDFET